MGFLIPAIGLALFIVPVFVFWGGKQEETDFSSEEHPALKALEEARHAALVAEAGGDSNKRNDCEEMIGVDADPKQTAGADVIPGHK